MAERERMTAEQVVAYLMEEDGADFLRESLRFVVEALMEAEVSELIGAARGERTPERATHGNGYRARRWDTRAGELELRIPKLRRGSYFPSFLEPRRRSERALLAVIQRAYVCGVSTRRVDQLVESLGLRISRSEVSRVCAQLDEQVEAFLGAAARGRLPLAVVGRRGRKGQGRRAGGGQGRRDRLRRARVGPTRDPRHRRRRGRDRGVLDGVPARPGGARPDGRAAGRLRCPRGPQAGDRPRALVPMATLHGPLPQGLPRPRPPRPARAAGRADPPDLPGRLR
jgi:hypothetical protein